jgi:quinol monooxygenase YgiN
MSTRNWITVIVRWDVTDPQGFAAMAEEMATASRREPGTHLYDWYVDVVTGQGLLLESYPSHDALMAHVNGPVFTEIAPRHRGVGRPAAVEVFGGEGMDRTDLLKAPTTWWGEPIAAVTD